MLVISDRQAPDPLIDVHDALVRDACGCWADAHDAAIGQRSTCTS